MQSHTLERCLVFEANNKCFLLNAIIVVIFLQGAVHSLRVRHYHFDRIKCMRQAHYACIRSFIFFFISLAIFHVQLITSRPLPPPSCCSKSEVFFRLNKKYIKLLSYV